MRLFVLFHILGGRERESTIFEGALDVVGNWSRVQDFSTFEIFTVAIWSLRVIRMGLCQGENLIFRKTLHHQLHLSPSDDAAAQVILQLHLRGIQFLAIVAILSGVLLFPVGSVSGNWISVEESVRGDYHAVYIV
jgi:hypothetical protein